MTPFQVCAEFSQAGENLQAEIRSLSERNRLKRQRQIFQQICFVQGIDPRHLPNIPIEELARHVRAMFGSQVDHQLLRSGVGEFIAGK